jgi:eukaryotic-like serine/threonine-protein kinase
MNSLDDLPGGVLCPSQKDLVAFSSGDLPTQALEAIAEHLSRCPRCLSALGTMTDDASSTLRDLRRALHEPVPDPFADDPEYRRMADAVITLYPARRTTDQWLNDAPAPELTPPFALGQYQVVEKIGQGGMGSVYRALHPRLKKEFAVKILRAESTVDPRAVARFRREMEAIGRLDHNNIVRATDAGEACGLHFLVMELIAGIDLSRLIRIRGPLPVADACELVRQAAAGLQCAHEHGLVHRDVKPSNLMLSAKGELKVLDLGVALLNRNGPASSELTVRGQLMGTPDYTAPEQWEASHDVDIRADVYSLGCTLYTLLMGRPPFAGPKYASTLQKMAAHVGEPVPHVAAHRQDVPAAVERFLERMVAKEPANRPSTPAEVARGLEPFTRGADLAALAGRGMDLLPAPELPAPLAQPAVTGEGTPAQPRRRGRRHRRVAALAALVVLLTGALAVFGWHLWVEPKGSPDLLASPPGTRLPPHGINALLQYDREKRHVRFESSNHALIPLGKTDAQSYRLEIGFQQPQWVGGFGVYFGGHEGAAPEVFHFQLIDLRPAPPGNGLSFQLVRGTGTIRLVPEAPPRVPIYTFAHTILPNAPDNSEQILRLDVKDGSLFMVRWNGAQCQELVSDDAAVGAKGARFQGEFGIYCVGCSGTVMTARYWITE